MFGPFIGAVVASLVFEFGYQHIVTKLADPEGHDIISIFEDVSEHPSENYKSEPMFASDIQNVTKSQRKSLISSDSSEDSKSNS